MDVVATVTDRELMLRVKDGDDQSFAGLLSRYRKPVVNFIYRMVQNQGIAEELAQEVFLRVYRARTNYEPRAKFTTWLFCIATNIALNSIRDGKRSINTRTLDDPGSYATLTLKSEDPTVEEEMVARSLEWEVRQAIGALPERQKTAVILHKYEELNYQQIAAALDCSESAVKSLLFRAYESLRVRLNHLSGDKK
jgi:RNA polymerase sigma-70 factor (ECF subfamily)